MYSDHQQIGHPYPHSSHHQGNEDQIRIVDPTEVPPEVMQPGNNYLKVQYILKQNVVNLILIISYTVLIVSGTK
jgi:hypothetical protein